MEDQLSKWPQRISYVSLGLGICACSLYLSHAIQTQSQIPLIVKVIICLGLLGFLLIENLYLSTQIRWRKKSGVMQLTLGRPRSYVFTTLFVSLLWAAVAVLGILLMVAKRSTFFDPRVRPLAIAYILVNLMAIAQVFLFQLIGRKRPEIREKGIWHFLILPLIIWGRIESYEWVGKSQDVLRFQGEKMPFPQSLFYFKTARFPLGPSQKQSASELIQSYLGEPK